MKIAFYFAHREPLPLSVPTQLRDKRSGKMKSFAGRSRLLPLARGNDVRVVGKAPPNDAWQDWRVHNLRFLQASGVLGLTGEAMRSYMATHWNQMLLFGEEAGEKK